MVFALGGLTRNGVLTRALGGLTREAGVQTPREALVLRRAQPKATAYSQVIRALQSWLSSFLRSLFGFVKKPEFFFRNKNMFTNLIYKRP